MFLRIVLTALAALVASDEELESAIASIRHVKHPEASTGAEKRVAGERAAATADDLGLLLRVRGVVYGRLSDECLYEVNTLNRLISRLGRARFRAEPGVCAEVRPR